MTVLNGHEWLFRRSTGLLELTISCKDGQTSVHKNSMFFIAKHFGIGSEEFSESDLLILDGTGMEELKIALGKLLILNVEEVTDLFEEKRFYSVEIDVPKDIELFDHAIKTGTIDNIVGFDTNIKKEGIETKTETIDNVHEFNDSMKTEAYDISLKSASENRCNICNKTFQNSMFLRKHMKTHVPMEQRPLGCIECTLRFSSKSRLKAHVQYVHSNERPEVCHICTKAFPDKSNL